MSFNVRLFSKERASLHRGNRLLRYDVENTAHGIELRRYTRYDYAAINVTGAQSEALERGFAALRDYVNAGNADEDQLQMSLPLSQILIGHHRGCEEGREWRVASPIEGRGGRLSAPEDPSITIHTSRSERLAVLTLAGADIADPVAAQPKLDLALQKFGLHADGALRLLLHDDPATPVDLRLTELAVPV